MHVFRKPTRHSGSRQYILANFRVRTDGVVYLELRTTPRAFPKDGLDKAAYVNHVLTAIDAAQRRFPSIQVRLILSIG